MKAFIKLHILLALGLILSGCGTAGVIINSAASVYCSGISTPGKQIVRNGLTGGTQIIYCPGEEDVPVHTP